MDGARTSSHDLHQHSDNGKEDGNHYFGFRVRFLQRALHWCLHERHIIRFQSDVHTRGLGLAHGVQISLLQDCGRLALRFMRVASIIERPRVSLCLCL